jgi:hypothetical protein
MSVPYLTGKETTMTIYGSDASHYDGPDFRRAIADGLSFFTHKAGGDALDAELGPWWQLMAPHRTQVLLGAYWVLYPGTPVARADAFLARLDAVCPGWRDGPFILQVDCEKWGGNSATVPPRTDIKAFCDRLAAKAPGLRPIVYGPKWVYGDTLTGLGYPLWASAYVTGGSGTPQALYPGDSSSKWAAYSGQTPAVLQFTDAAVIAGQTTCDANAFRGSLAQLTALVAPGWEITDMALDDRDAQVIASKLGHDLLNPDSDVSKGLRMNLMKVFTDAQPYSTAGPGARIAARGWTPVSPKVILEYLFEIIAADVRHLPDGTPTVLPGGLTARLERIENIADAAAINFAGEAS